jgi:hypothetical protein
LNKKITFKQSKEYATGCYEYMVDILQEVERNTGIKILAGAHTAENNFMDKVLNLQTFRTFTKVNGYLTSVEEIMNGKDLSKLNEYEAAKIIGLGTVVGVAQQRALALKTMTPTKVKEFSEEFICVVNSIKDKASETTSNPPAFKSGGTLRDLIVDSTLETGLMKLTTPLVLLRVFPMFGLALKVKRNQGYEMNPFKVSLHSYADDKKFIDTSTFEFKDYKLVISSEEEYNLVCPLLGEEDAYLAPLFQTKLFEYIMSYWVTWEMDGTLKKSYLSIFSDVFIHALRNKDKELLDKCMTNIKVFREHAPESDLAQYIETVEMGDYSEIKTCSKLTPFFMAHYYLATTNGDLEVEEADEFVEKMWLRYFKGRIDKLGVGVFVQTGLAGSLENAVYLKYNPDYIMENFYTSRDFRNHIMKGNFANELDTIGAQTADPSKVTLNPAAFTSDTNDLLSFKTIKKICKKIYPEGKKYKFEDLACWSYLAHLVIHQENYLDNPVEFNIKLAKKTLVKKSTMKAGAVSNLASLKRSMPYRVVNNLMDIYFNEYEKRHWNTVTMTRNEIKKGCAERGYDFSKIQFHGDLPRNACVSPGCPHQFKPMGYYRDFMKHLRGWRKRRPLLNWQSFVQRRMDTPNEQVYQEFITKYGRWNGPLDVETLGVTKEMVMDYIQVVKDKCEKIRNGTVQ